MSHGEVGVAIRSRPPSACRGDTRYAPVPLASTGHGRATRREHAVVRGGGVRFRVLGPIEAYDGGTCLALGGPKPRLLLAALLMEADRVVPATRLVDILWGDAPPESSRALVHTYVSSLRRALNRPGNDEIIVTRPPGYLVRVGPGELDRTVFEEQVVAARAAGQAGRHSEAAERFRTAEALWHGAAYGGIGDSIFVAEAAR